MNIIEIKMKSLQELQGLLDSEDATPLDRILIQREIERRLHKSAAT